MIEYLIGLVDAEELAIADCEPDIDEASDDEIEAWQEWHTYCGVRHLTSRRQRGLKAL